MNWFINNTTQKPKSWKGSFKISCTNFIMDIKILEQYKLVLNNKKSYILVLNALPNYRSEKVQIGNDIFDFFLVYREKIQLTIIL